ncbi:MAG: exopolysaccharide biosynthesis protein [Lunatimonas sp.]|uniref:exopolysaccharide biosynthesis protein n=1 Tax=Lunatimonas sp. TaxID=2060141 RepID=UPI00263BCAAF|nr:exopolysaccharide biosynthesis protein [Lunatimonas sp.]MCC5938452.1 exopolysaccharide biosynthesis protein [Lunatimonas sp.]
MSEKHILEDKLTLRDVVLRTKWWVGYFWSKWRIIVLWAVAGFLLGGLVSIWKKPVYVAETSFVLEDADNGGLGQMSGLASLVGVNLGSLGGSSGLFQGDNIIELYRSNNMIGKTLLSPFDRDRLLIERFIAFNELDKKWKKAVDLNALDFRKPRETFSVTQDSVMREVSRLIRENHLSVNKPDRKLSIIQVNISSKDEQFAKVFNETLVENVNGFYFETKTKKTSENLNILQAQADSVRRILDTNLEELAALSDRMPSPNPLMQAGNIGVRKKQIDVQSSSAIYAEIVKNLEIAKVNQRNNSPLIQIIDGPRYPLERFEIKPLKGVVLGAFFAVFAGILVLYVREVYRRDFGS